MKKTGLAMVLLAACGSDDVFSLQTFDNAVAVETAAIATLHESSPDSDSRDVSSVRVVGDLDGDGIDDAIVIGQHRKRENGGATLQPLEYRVLYGGAQVTGALDAASLPRLLLDADSPGDSWHYEIEAIGDVDGDGLADLLINQGTGTACDGYKDTGPRDAQPKVATLLYGSHTRIAADVAISSIGVALRAPACQGNFLKFARLGDFDGDGVDDFGVLDVGRYTDDPDVLYLFYGGARMSGPVDYQTAAAAIIAPELANPMRTIERITALGDVDGDGADDIAIEQRVGNRGSVRIVRGSATRLAGSTPVDALPSLGSTIDSLCFNDVSTGLGDLDGDGYRDFALLTCSFDLLGFTAAEFHLFYGGPTTLTPNLALANAAATLQLQAPSLGELTAGDFDADGHRDLAISGQALNHFAGGAFVMQGTSARLSGAIPFTTGTIGYVGHAVAVECLNTSQHDCTDGMSLGTFLSAGDLDGDGRDDLTMAAMSGDVGAVKGGASVFVVSPGDGF